MDDLLSLTDNLDQDLKDFGLKVMQIKTIKNTLKVYDKLNFGV